MRNKLKVQVIRDSGVNGFGPNVETRTAAGKALRDRAARTSHANWSTPSDRPDPVDLLKASDRGRLAELLPIRYGRMRQSPFAFFRGAAAVMAWDLARTPVTGIRVQACGDCHAANFGGFASPERQLLFDINDFDETLRGPWEWDVKRLAASVLLASRELGLGESRCLDAARTLAFSYRRHIREYARMRPLEVWYSHMDAEVFVEEAKTVVAKKYWESIERKARLQTAEHIFPKLTDVVNGRIRIVDHPPLVYHPRSSDLMRKHVTEMFRNYRETLPART